MIDQFFWSGTNERADKFGDTTITERGRFASEVVKTICEAGKCRVRSDMGAMAKSLERISQVASFMNMRLMPSDAG